MLNYVLYMRLFGINKKYSIPLFIGFVLILLTSTVLSAQDIIYDANDHKINIELHLTKAEEQLKLGDEKEATRHLNIIAEGYWNGKHYHKAIKYYIKSIRLNETINNESGIGSISSNLGMIHADLKDYENSLSYFNTAISIRKKLKETSGLISTHINASVVLNKLKRYEESISNLEQALLLSTESNDPDRMKSCYGMLAETYEKQGDGERMLQYYNLYRTFHELVEKTKRKKIQAKVIDSELKAKYAEAQKRIKELELLNAQKKLAEQEKVITQKDTVYQNLMERYSKSELANKIISNYIQVKDLRISQSNEQLKREQDFVNVLYIAITSVFVLLVLLLISYQQKKAKNKTLSKKNKEINRQHNEIIVQQQELEKYFNIISSRNEHITSSINYAKLIQKAVLGDKEKIIRLFSDSFIFFKPKDIVSGDFYWFKKINGYNMLAVADCTGHGVPGALMSMLGINLINQITSQGIHEVDLILKELCDGVRNALNANSEYNEISRDGMDISLLAFDSKKNQVIFSGAKHSLYYIQNDKLHVAQGNRQSIGSSTRKSSSGCMPFTKHIIDTSTPTSIYAFSDGIVDQFNQQDEKKFLRRRLKKLFLNIHKKPAAEQKQILTDTFVQWKGNQIQTDDIIVVGINLEPKQNTNRTDHLNLVSSV